MMWLRYIHMCGRACGNHSRLTMTEWLMPMCVCVSLCACGTYDSSATSERNGRKVAQQSPAGLIESRYIYVAIRDGWERKSKKTQAPWSRLPLVLSRRKASGSSGFKVHSLLLITRPLLKFESYKTVRILIVRLRAHLISSALQPF